MNIGLRALVVSQVANLKQTKNIQLKLFNKM